MPYSCSMEDLLSVLSDKAPAKADAVSKNRRVVQYGKLSVGIKLHFLKEIEALEPFFASLREVGGNQFLNPNGFKMSKAGWCMVFSPVGSAVTAIELLHTIEQGFGVPIFNNPLIHLQVCSPGRLSPRQSALLAIAFYLGSDTLRRYDTLEDLETTFSRSATYPRARRIVLYDAEGTFERNFAFWKGVPPKRKVQSQLPFESGRSDVLVGPGSALDVKNINLIATLLIHAENNGYWKQFGFEFIKEMEGMLHRHGLLHLLDAPWVRDDEALSGRDNLFHPALQELVAFAFEQSARVKLPPTNPLERLFAKWREIPKRRSIDCLKEMRDLLIGFNSRIVNHTRALEHPGGNS